MGLLYNWSAPLFFFQQICWLHLYFATRCVYVVSFCLYVADEYCHCLEPIKVCEDYGIADYITLVDQSTSIGVNNFGTVKKWLVDTVRQVPDGSRWLLKPVFVLYLLGLGWGLEQRSNRPISLRMMNRICFVIRRDDEQFMILLQSGYITIWVNRQYNKESVCVGSPPSDFLVMP